MKGQNLRLMYKGKCFAGSLSCRFHIGVQTESASTNDTEGDYEEVDVTGKSWEASTDALVFSALQLDITILHTSTTGAYGEILDVSTDTIDLEPGMTIALECNSITNLYVINKDSSAVLATQYGKQLLYTNNTDSTIHLITGVDHEKSPHQPAHALVVDNEATNVLQMIEAIKNGEEFILSLATTTGKKNRENEETMLSGRAILSDLQINSQNKQRPSYTAQFTGISYLE